MEYWFSFLLMDYRFIYTVSTSNCIFILLYVRITDFILFWLMAVNVLLKGFSHFTFHQFMHYTPTEVFQKGRKRDRAGTKSFFLCLVPNILFPQESGSTLDHADKFLVGTKVQAVWSEDGEWWVETSVVIALFSFLFFNFWSFYILFNYSLPFLSLSCCWFSWFFRYDATIHAHTPNGYYVCYEDWGNKEEVLPSFYALMEVFWLALKLCFSFSFIFSSLLNSFPLSFFV